MTLALSTLALFLAMPLIVWEYPVKEYAARGWEISSYVSPYRYYVTAILCGTALFFNALAIFLYTRRSLQILLLFFSMLFVITAASFVFWRYYSDQFDGYLQLSPWNLLALVTLLLQGLAIIYIRKDEQLIRSLDRMR